MKTNELKAKNNTPRPIFLADYKPPTYFVKEIKLSFDLDDEKTIVSSQMKIHQNSHYGNETSPLRLNGENMKLLSIKVDGRSLNPEEYSLDDHSLTLMHPTSSFLLEIVNEINPKQNTALDGLYKSGTILCTQNEPEGFRKITYFPDRSDVMAKYSTKIMGDKKLYPILLSNGNEIGRGNLENGKHWVEWEDPFAKPSYLFALVAGDLGSISDSFTTMSGRKIELKIFCDKGNEDKCHHSMLSLKKAMKWDEEVYGLEYDLNTYMIVAVDAFNMGAMENKGLNIFNTSCALADVATATDDNFARIETVIAHEYFHNWTGNRVTCRDWFQLTLKEGLTVFRDQEFTADMQSRPVQRIDQVLALRGSQFPEDAGPTAHPIQPKSYIQINNFYTSTVYNKGAEIIRMIQTLIGPQTFQRGITKYFELYDGQAVTTEDFIHSMELASGRDFTQFKRWYSQAGTPEIVVDSKYDPEKKTLTLKISQNCAPTADQSEKEPFEFPLAIALLGKEGRELPLKIAGTKLSVPYIVIKAREESVVFEDVNEVPVLSINRNFSAPIKSLTGQSRQETAFLMTHDTDPFNRWEASQKLATDLMLEMVADLSNGKYLKLDVDYIKAFGAVLNDANLENALKAKALILPSEATLGQYQTIIDFDGIHLVREFVLKKLASTYQKQFKDIYSSLNTSESYHFDAASSGKRGLKNVCLGYLAFLETPETVALCENQFKCATNMTDQFSALSMLANIDVPQRKEALQAFYKQWKNNTLVMNKWLAIQALSKLDGAFETVHALMKDPVFDLAIPNLVRALIFSFSQNAVHFHRNDGAGYAFLADRVIEIDKLNPQLAAFLSQPFKKLDKLDPMRKKAMKRELNRIMAEPNLSPNVYEIVSKSLSWDEKKE
ncbi:MAG: aminopeptidase N [Parachlamydiaceae bacterium]|nr:aminopeptidase N [Parachlamydiaceae bacterium]